MNLTYDDCDYSLDVQDDRTRTMLGVRAAHQMAQAAGATKNAQGTQLSGFFQDVVSSIKRTNLFPIELTKGLVTGGPSGALNAMKTEAKAAVGDVASMGAPIGAALSVIPGVGTIVGGAIGAASKFAKADQDKARAALNAQIGNDANVNTAYKQIAGQVAGRDIGVPTLKEVMKTFVRMGGFPPLQGGQKAISAGADSAAADSAYANAQKAAAQGIARGATPLDIYNNEFKQLWAGNPQQQWMGGQYVTPPGSDQNVQSEIFLDMIDAAMTAIRPDLPYFYGRAADAAAAPPQSVPSTGVVASPNVPTPVLTTTTPPVAYPSTPTQPVVPTPPVAPTLPALAQTGVDPQTQANLAAMLQQMQAQGASQQAQYAALISALSQAGANTQAPAVQQAAAQTVAQPITAGLSGVPTWLMIALGVGAVAFAFAMPARSRGRGPRRNYRAARRRLRGR